MPDHDRSDFGYLLLLKLAFVIMGVALVLNIDVLRQKGLLVVQVLAVTVLPLARLIADYWYSVNLIDIQEAEVTEMSVNASFNNETLQLMIVLTRSRMAQEKGDKLHEGPSDEHIAQEGSSVAEEAAVEVLDLSTFADLSTSTPMVSPRASSPLLATSALSMTRLGAVAGTTSTAIAEHRARNAVELVQDPLRADIDLTGSDSTPKALEETNTSEQRVIRDIYATEDCQANQSTGSVSDSAVFEASRTEIGDSDSSVAPSSTPVTVAIEDLASHVNTTDPTSAFSNSASIAAAVNAHIVKDIHATHEPNLGVVMSSNAISENIQPISIDSAELGIMPTSITGDIHVERGVGLQEMDKSE